MRRLPHFAGLPDDALEWLSARAQVLRVDAGEALSTGHDPVNALLIVENGRLLVRQNDAGSHPVDVTAGGWIGEGAVMLGSGREWAVAAEPSVVRRIERQTVDELIFRCCDAALGPPPSPAPAERPRTSSGAGIHVVLSAGGARGLAHVGVLQVLVDAGIHISGMTAVSAGALFAAMFCAGIPIADITTFTGQLVALVRRRGGLWDYLDPPSVGTIRGALTRDLFDRVLGGVRFADLATPLEIVAADMCVGIPVVLANGSVSEAVRASMGVPGIYAPWPLEGRYLADGGLVDALPVGVARRRCPAPGLIVACDTVGPAEDLLPPSPGAASPAALLLARARAMHAIASPAAKPADITIAPAVDDYEVISYGSSEELIRSGREAALAVLDILRPLRQP